MNNRCVIITGGTKGLGRELSMAFGRAGYFVMALYSTDEISASSLRDMFDKSKVDGCVCKHDVCSENNEIWSHKKIQDADSLTLIHNACPAFSPTPLHKLGWIDFEKNLNTAVKGAFLCTQALIRPMLKKGNGCIVAILSSSIDDSPKGFAAYATAKQALHGFTRSLAAEYSSRGLKIFSVSPGFMNTPLTENWDSRLKDAIQSSSSRLTDPASAARQLVQLVENKTTRGQGENYPL